VLFGAIVFALFQLVRGPAGIEVPAEGLAANVPEGAIALMHFEAAGVLDTPLARSMVEAQGREKELDEALAQVRSMDAFVLAPQDGPGAGGRLAMCGVIRMGPQARKELLQMLSREGKRVKAGDAYAFRVTLEQRGPLGFPTPMGPGGPKTLFLAPASPEAVAMATTGRSLGMLAAALAQPSPTSEQHVFADMAREAGGDPLWLAIDGRTAMKAFPDGMKDAPESIKGMQACLLSLRVGEDVNVRGILRLASQADAAEVLAKAQEAVANAVARIEDGEAQPGLPVAAAVAVLNRISLSSSGPDVGASMVLTGEDLQQMLGLVFMSALAAGMQAPGPM
jgi:hypothetical protein